MVGNNSKIGMDSKPYTPQHIDGKDWEEVFPIVDAFALLHEFIQLRS